MARSKDLPIILQGQKCNQPVFCMNCGNQLLKGIFVSCVLSCPKCGQNHTITVKRKQYSIRKDKLNWR